MPRDLLDYDKITSEDIMENDDLNKQVLSLVNQRRSDSWSFVQEKREAFNKWKLLMTDPSRGFGRETMIKVYTAIEQRKAFIATFLDDEFIEFSGREFGDDDKAFKLNMAAKYDKEAMKKTSKDYHWLSNMFDYGV